MKHLFLAFTLFLGFTSCSQSPSSEGGDQIADNVGVDAFSEFETVDGAQLLDVRTDGEFHQGHIPDALHININAAGFAEKVAELDKEKPVYVYCRSGGRSARAMQQMKQMGFKEVHNLKGGILAWQRAGKEVK